MKVPTAAALLWLVLLAAGAADAARLLRQDASAMFSHKPLKLRLLRQDVSTISSMGKNPLKLTSLFAQAREAESKSNSMSSGIYHNEATIYAEAGGMFPAPRDSVSAAGGTARAGGGTGGFQVNAFGAVATAATDTERARAFSGTESMPIHPYQVDGSAHSTAATTVSYDAVDYHKGTGKTRLVFTDSIGINRLAPLSAGISNVGAGPMAVAAAGEAVTMSMADMADNPFNPSSSLANGRK